MDYRLYFKDGRDRIVRAVEFEAKSDDEAISLAEEHMAEGEPLELWSLARKVCEIPALSIQRRG